MTESERDPHPDSPSEAKDDRPSDLERAVNGGGEDVEGVGGPQETPLEPAGIHDGNSGTGGVVKNQDDTQQ